MCSFFETHINCKNFNQPTRMPPTLDKGLSLSWSIASEQKPQPRAIGNKCS